MRGPGPRGPAWMQSRGNWLQTNGFAVNASTYPPFGINACQTRVTMYGDSVLQSLQQAVCKYRKRCVTRSSPSQHSTSRAIETKPFLQCCESEAAHTRIRRRGRVGCVRAGSLPVAVGWPRLAYAARLQRLRISTLALLMCSEHVAVAPMGNESQPCSSEERGGVSLMEQTDRVLDRLAAARERDRVQHRRQALHHRLGDQRLGQTWVVAPGQPGEPSTGIAMGSHAVSMEGGCRG